jgi:gliding motility-associated-like protein/uncharacterized repeat protein (TIGR01451 family)
LTRTPVTLTINPAPAAPTATNQAVCTDGTTTQTLTATATGGTITWYSAATGGTVVTSPTQVGVGSRTYYAEASNGTCSSLTRTPVTLTINPAPAAPTATNQAVCTDGTTTQTLTATATGGTITWYSAATGGSIVTSPTQVGVGTRTIFAQASDGTCSSLTRTAVTLTINPATAAPTAINQTVCTDGTTTQTLTATATGGTITWYSAATGATVVTSPTQVGVGSATYYAQASNGTCSSLTRTPITLTINSAIIFTAVATQPKCFGEKGFVTLSTPTGGTGTITFNSTPSTNLDAGAYVYTATDAIGCFTTITITINAAPTQVVLTTTATPISCFGGTATVTLNTTGGSGTYTYDAANPALSGLTTGTYIYKVKDLNDCEATVSITITQPIALPSASAVIVNNNNCVGCSNGSITQTVSGGTMTYTYLWSNGATSKDLANLVAGTYSVEIKDINGCTANYSYRITDSGIALVKTGTFSDTNNDGFAQVDEKINYSFIVTNTGNVSLSNIVVTDPMIGLVFTNNNIASLAVGSSSTIAGTYTLTQADVDGGKVTNTALAAGKDLNGIDVSDTSGTSLNNNTPTVTLLVQQGNISITKDGIYVDSNNDGTTNIGDKITYNFVVTNTGNVTITNVIVSDPLPGLVLTGSPITLNKGASNATQFVGTYSLTQADIDAGVVYNLATVTGTLPFGERVTATSADPTPCTNCSPQPDCRNCTITILNKNPRLEVIKTAPTSGYSLVGDVLNYNIIVKNVGNVTLFQILVTDPLTGLNTIIASLAPGASQEFNEDYIVTKIDLETNTVTNTAFATGRTIENLVISDSDIVEINKSLVLGCGTILVHNAFSPNGDGINDVFNVENISNTDCYPENSVEIFNRWGVLVFETKNYNNQSNNFEGISRGRTTINQSSGLPAGTYFYILNYTSVDGNGDILTNQKDGYLYLTK